MNPPRSKPEHRGGLHDKLIAQEVAQFMTAEITDAEPRRQNSNCRNQQKCKHTGLRTGSQKKIVRRFRRLVVFQKFQNKITLEKSAPALSGQRRFQHHPERRLKIIKAENHRFRAASKHQHQRKRPGANRNQCKHAPTHLARKFQRKQTENHRKPRGKNRAAAACFYQDECGNQRRRNRKKETACHRRIHSSPRFPEPGKQNGNRKQQIARIGIAGGKIRADPLFAQTRLHIVMKAHPLGLHFPHLLHRLFKAGEILAQSGPERKEQSKGRRPEQF